VVELLDLGYGFTRMVIASPEGSGISSPSDYRPGLRVATEFPNLTRRYFSQKGVEVEVVNLTGAAEIAPLIGVADLIVDVTSTGTTLRTHRLRVVDTILESTARLVANPRSLKEKGGEDRGDQDGPEERQGGGGEEAAPPQPPGGEAGGGEEAAPGDGRSHRLQGGGQGAHAGRAGGGEGGGGVQAGEGAQEGGGEGTSWSSP